MFRKKILFILCTIFLIFNTNAVYGAEATSYTTLWTVDIWTFNEYKYKITEQYIDLRNKFEVTWRIDSTISARILNLAENAYKYLPDDLINKNYFNYLKTAIEKWQLYPENSSYFQDIATKIEDYLEKTSIQWIKWNIEAIPSSWNAPLSVTLRWNVVDPTWTKLENYNYTWWMNVWGRKVVIWNKVALNYVFKEEWNFTVFLDVTSNHKNASGNPDVLPFSSRTEIEVKEKIASIVVKVNGINLSNQEELKFLPDEARYWLLFDATSSTPTSWTQFIRTEWDFGNGVKRTYDWPPQIERVVFASEWDYTVKLLLKTNAWKSVEKKFIIRIHQPIATINASAEEWFMWDKFTFSTVTNTNQTNLTFAWRIIDINNDTEIVWKNSSTFTYTFTKKWRYNVQLFVTEPSWDVDYDSKIIYINSRAPEAKLTYSVPNQNKPNMVFLDASSSYDADHTDDWKLEFTWQIDGQEVNLNNPNYNWSNWYYSFSSLWDHSVTVTVTDTDNMSAIKTEKINIKSLLSVDFNIFPRVSQVGKTIRFMADSSKAQYFEWDFWDWTKKWETSDTVTHTFTKSWIFQVKLRVVDENDKENIFTKNVFIGDADYPYPFITLKDNKQNEIVYEENQCNWEPAYIINRVDTYSFNANESLDITGNNTWLSYSWKIWNSLYSSQIFQKRFEDLWCYKVKLAVTSDKNGKSASQEVNVKVVNLKPILGSVELNVKDINADPVIVTVTAQWAKDEDWVIQSYLWYYYTDLDPEPQDFRSTRVNQTTFVLPKVTWNYYFAVVMKDNNEARVNSEEINDSRYFVTLTWDNVNTPLLDLKVNNNSIAIWDEVVFTANVENILWQNLNNVASYSWDFDWDGFYDLETNTNVASYRYKNSWEIYAKVRVKYKWFSNTKTLTINVANILKADFDYVSIWNHFIFFDNSLSNGATYEWDMWDWNKITTKWAFSYTYTDWKVAHEVKLKLVEWTKISEKTKRVVKNMPNFLTSNREDLAVFSNFPIEDESITLSDNATELYLYLTSKLDDVSYYVADFNINYDSDLNWWNDDDEDNKSQDSYTEGWPIFIELDSSKKQVVRVYLKDSSSNILVSRDISIIKEYIEENIDINEIVFEWVSESTKLKLEKIKQAVNNFPGEHRLKWMIYVQKLQEEWNDEREKTNTIIEFEWFIWEINIPWASDLIDLLESLLVEWENDKSEKAIAYTALKNLIPKSIQCVWASLEELDATKTCYELLIEKLDMINENTNVDENKVLWLQILENIAEDLSMTVKEKMDFKAILNTFVYWWLSNIPSEEIEDVIKNEPKEGWGSKIISILVAFIKLIWFALLIITWIIIAFFVYYKTQNKDPELWFTDFISERTWWNRKTIGSKSNDILGEDILDIDTIVDTSKEDNFKKEVNLEKEKTETPEENIDNSEKVDDWNVPDWLKWSFSDDFNWGTEKQVEEAQVVEPIVEDKKEEIDTKDSISESNEWEIPDWLKWSFSDDFNWETEKQVEETQVLESIVEDEKEKIDAKDSISESNEWEIPDWLKWSFSDDFNWETEEQVDEAQVEKPIIENKEEKIDIKESTLDTEEKEDIDLSKQDVSDDNEPSLKTKEELDEFTKLELDDEDYDSNSNIPDWLKWSLEPDSNQNEQKAETLVKEEKIEEVEEKIPVEVKEEKPKTREIKEEIPSKTEEEVIDKTSKEETKTTAKRRAKKKTTKKLDEELINKEKVENDTKNPTNEPKKQSPKKIDNKENILDEKENEITPWSIPELDLAPDTELWDDWMKIPDWLKTEEEK